MAAPALIVDPGVSKLIIRTRAAGMLARLAHDLEIEAASLRGQATRQGEDLSGELFVSVASLRVVGALRVDRVDPTILSAGDRAEIERRLREEVLGRAADVRVRGQRRAGDRAELTVELPSGRADVSAAVQVSAEGERVRVEGRVELSLKRLGVAEIKGPLGAFRVRDDVEVRFDLTLRPEK
jgi:hypothetical protein